MQEQNEQKECPPEWQRYLDNQENSYRILRLRDDTGKSYAVPLIDPFDDENENLTREEFNIEMKVDVHRAIEQFDPVEQRVLFRVLVRGLSIEQATARCTSRPLRTWQRWMQETALPKLRESLHDYYETTGVEMDVIRERFVETGKVVVR